PPPPDPPPPAAHAGAGELGAVLTRSMKVGSQPPPPPPEPPTTKCSELRVVAGSGRSGKALPALVIAGPVAVVSCVRPSPVNTGSPLLQVPVSRPTQTSPAPFGPYTIAVAVGAVAAFWTFLGVVAQALLFTGRRAFGPIKARRGATPTWPSSGLSSGMSLLTTRPTPPARNRPPPPPPAAACAL